MRSHRPFSMKGAAWRQLPFAERYILSFSFGGGPVFWGTSPPLCSDLCGTDRNQGIFRYRYRVCKSPTIFCRRTFVCIKPGVRVTNCHISRKKVYRFLSLVREPGRVPYLTILLRQKNTNGLLMRVGVDCILAVIKFGRGNLSFQTG